MEQPARPIAYVVADSRGDTEFRDRESFVEAMRGADPVAVVTEVSRWPDDDDPDMQRFELCEVRTADDWHSVVSMVRFHVRRMFMQGDCWHLALALNRIYGLELAAVVNHHPDGSRSVSHVAAALPDGGYLDVRGHLPNEEELCKEGTNCPSHSVRPATREEIMAILDGYAQENGCEPTDWEDPAAYPFAWQAELVARIVLGDMASRQGPPASLSPGR